ncbi:hypothetical protein DBV15_04235 [Temnothorax longispinosus]|uniref:Uncharacterized protein n=1 Tax=Temnothorax longispinosus TaxID=300112 RepID=A0A4S2KLW6_9HYME|nr:hypothetical protein DBV15_04235 [Temnothorax longispinosus]
MFNLQLFSLQVLHRKNIFSAMGLTVDAKLLTAMVGNISTYLLILIQFLNMSHFCAKEIATNLFSLQLSHCENRFSAKGLTVDATLLTAMAGGIITYLVILVQFLVTWNSCNEKSFQGFKGKRKGKIWQLFCATDFVSLMYPCFSFCRILGIFPYKINASIIKTCEPRYILSTIIIGVFCILELINLYDMRLFSLQISHCENTFSAKGLTVDAALLTKVAGSITTYLMRLFSLQILHCENAFSVKGLTVDSTLLTAMRLFSLQISHCDNVFSAKGLTVDATLLTKLQLFSLQILHRKNMFSAMGLTVDARLLTAMVGNISTYLLILIQFLNMKHFCAKEIATNIVNKITTYLLILIQFLINSHTCNGNILQLFSLQILHRKNMFSAMGLTVDARLLTVMVGNISTYLLILIQFLNMKHFCAKEIASNLKLFSLQILHRKNMFSAKGLILDASLLTAMVGNISTYLLILIQFLNMKHFCAKEIATNLQMFSLQVLHRENAFSAKGLIVDATLLTAIVGNITTYLLILIQFLITSHTCNGKILQMFSLQILHRENAFSAKGLVVDATLLTAIVSNITTYLLILIQFLITSHTCNGNILQLFSLQILHRKNIFSAMGLTVDASLLTAMVGNISTYLLILIQFLNMKRFCAKEIATNLQLFSLQVLHRDNTFSAKGLTIDSTLLVALHLFSLQTLHCENTFSAKGFIVDAKLLAAVVGNIVTYLHLFSLQILHCQNTFSAKGLTVDATLLTTIVGNIATYLLILTQFFNMSHSCDGKTATSLQLFSLQILHRENTFSAKGLTVDASLLTALQLFSLQILHHENTFSAKGVTVDATLLTAMVGYITTHLLIFIQFLNASHSCDRKTAINLQIFSLQTLHCDNTFSAKGFTVNAKLLVVIVGTIATYVLILFQFMRMSNSCERNTTNNITELRLFSLQVMHCKNTFLTKGLTVDTTLLTALRLFSLQIMHCKNTFLTKGLTMDATLLTALRLFSLQILHRENTFSGKGFTMDATLLTTIVGNITTYMLILIQFLIASHSCDKKSGSNLQLFSLQILHCKNTFSAKGLTVDAALLTAIAGSITTYMLILIQFFIMTHSCDDKSLRLFSLQILHCKNTFLTKGLTMDATLLTALFSLQTLHCENTFSAKGLNVDATFLATLFSLQTLHCEDTFSAKGLNVDATFLATLQLFSLQILHCENTFSAKSLNVDAQFLATLQLFSLQTLHCKNTFSAKGLNVDATFLATLLLFSLQTLHCKNTFSAKGLNVDATFLATMAGTIATYMLILLQFLIISHPCDKKSAINSTMNNLQLFSLQILHCENTFSAKGLNVDAQFLTTLQLFSLQILHCKNTFSAKGLNVDAPFFVALVGTITTYMLILLQFLVISHACDEKSAINGTRIIYFRCKYCIVKIHFLPKVLMWTHRFSLHCNYFLCKYCIEKMHSLQKVSLWMQRFSLRCVTNYLLQTIKCILLIFMIFFRWWLQLFSLQTLHCKNTFSAKGLNVDASFLTTMAGTSATYMLILLQFWMMSHSCDGKSSINTATIFYANTASTKCILCKRSLCGCNASHCGEQTIICFKQLNMVGSITTYLLILIQFLVTSHSCGGRALQLFSLQILHCENTFSAKGLNVDASFLATLQLFSLQILHCENTFSAKGLNVDAPFLATLQLFSMQILHRENTFSAKGLTVDATLLAAMVGSITTYLLILIQFLLQLFSLQTLHCKNTFSAKGLTVNAKLLAALRLFSLQILHCDNTFSAKGLTVDAKLLTAMVSSIATYLLILIQFLGMSHSYNGKTAINVTELHLFSLQILHRDNTFSAKGLTVDATFLTAMVGTITTYLLILIQFLITSHSCDGKIAINLHLFSLQILHTSKNTFSAKGFTMDAPLLATLIGSITTYLLILIQFANISNSCNEQFKFSNITQTTYYSTYAQKH